MLYFRLWLARCGFPCSIAFYAEPQFFWDSRRRESLGTECWRHEHGWGNTQLHGRKRFRVVERFAGEWDSAPDVAGFREHRIVSGRHVYGTRDRYGGRCARLAVRRYRHTDGGASRPARRSVAFYAEPQFFRDSRRHESLATERERHEYGWGNTQLHGRKRFHVVERFTGEWDSAPNVAGFREHRIVSGRHVYGTRDRYGGRSARLAVRGYRHPDRGPSRPARRSVAFFAEPQFFWDSRRRESLGTECWRHEHGWGNTQLHGRKRFRVVERFAGEWDSASDIAGFGEHRIVNRRHIHGTRDRYGGRCARFAVRNYRHTDGGGSRPACSLVSIAVRPQFERDAGRRESVGAERKRDEHRWRNTQPHSRKRLRVVERFAGEWDSASDIAGFRERRISNGRHVHGTRDRYGYRSTRFPIDCFRNVGRCSPGGSSGTGAIRCDRASS
jgi:hypothetical protein